MDVVLKGWDQGAINLNLVSSTCGARSAAAARLLSLAFSIQKRYPTVARNETLA